MITGQGLNCSQSKTLDHDVPLRTSSSQAVQVNEAMITTRPRPFQLLSGLPLFRLHFIVGTALLIASILASPLSAGVTTLITHGWNSGTDGWVSSLASAIERYPRTQFLTGAEGAVVYKLHFDSQGYARAIKLREPLGGPSRSGSGDIIIVLDWNPYSGVLFGTDGLSTEIVGPVVADALLSSSLFQGLGFPPVRMPLHLIGHSRGGSLVCEIAKSLGERNVVVDHMTLLDPHPLNNDEFFDLLFPVDGTAKNGVYDNVLFCDSYYQIQGIFPTPNGTFVNGAYVRYLGSSFIGSGGYGNPHSNAHLWYHGTAEIRLPLTSDSEATLNADMRKAWYATYEDQGATAGYYYSIRGGGSRREVFLPLDQYNGRPVDGLHGGWASSLGIAAGGVRTPLTRTAEIRGNLIELSLTNLLVDRLEPGGASFGYGGPIVIVYTNHVSGDLQCRLTYQLNGSSNAVLDICLDRDENWGNGVQKAVKFSLSPTGASPRTIRFGINGVLAGEGPGRYRVGARILSASGIREFYSPEVLVILPQLTMDWGGREEGGQVVFDFTIRGLKSRRYVLQRSSDLNVWEDVASGTLSDPGPAEIVGLAVWNGVGAPGRPFGFFRTIYRP